MNFNFIYFYNSAVSRPFQYFNYLTVKSCYLTQNKPLIYLHYNQEPNNIWWEKIKPYVILKKIDNVPSIIETCNNRTVWRLEHKCDIYRLLILREFGGVYSDLDVLFYKPFFPKFENREITMGKEVFENNLNGLCNGIIIAKRESKFLDIWYQSYLNEYDDYDWNKMSVRKPYELSLKYPELIDIESEDTFHKYGWSDEIFKQYTSLNDQNMYAKHLYASKVYDILSSYDDEKLKTEDSLFAKMCRNIDGLL